MKIWNGYGSEHSMNLVMIGHFENVTDAEAARQVIQKLTEVFNAQVDSGELEVGKTPREYTDAVHDVIRETSVYSLNLHELEQFVYDATITREGTDLVLTTDEVDVSAFFKVLMAKGAKVEIYSAHDHPGAGHGRVPGE